MSNSVECRECGAMTVSEGPQRLCFTCQIKQSGQGAAPSETFFFDGGPSLKDAVLTKRLESAIPNIRVDGELGRGGMGVVLRGVQEKLDRKIAVKVLPQRPGLTEAFINRFFNEAKAMARLQHPNIVAIHDFGQTDCGLFYIVMEFIEGRSLGAMMREGATDARTYVNMVADICDALAYAHAQNIVHRDMKPENVLVDMQGRVKIADFGIAKLEGAQHVERLTKTHQILGTPLYMAPEQALGARGVDHRADLYAVGVILHEMLTGEFPKASVSPPSRSVPIDARLDPIVLGLLAKKPQERLSSAQDVARDLREIAATWKQGHGGRGFFARVFGR